MTRFSPSRALGKRPAQIAGVLVAALLFAVPLMAQNRDMPEGEWRYQSGDAWGTRSSPLDQINADNFGDLKVAWMWRGDNFGPKPSFLSKSTPSYINGKLYTVVGYRRAVVSMDPVTGETLWTYTEPTTRR